MFEAVQLIANVVLGMSLLLILIVLTAIARHVKNGKDPFK